MVDAGVDSVGLPDGVRRRHSGPGPAEGDALDPLFRPALMLIRAQPGGLRDLVATIFDQLVADGVEGYVGGVYGPYDVVVWLLKRRRQADIPAPDSSERRHTYALQLADWMHGDRRHLPAMRNPQGGSGSRLPVRHTETLFTRRGLRLSPRDNVAAEGVAGPMLYEQDMPEYAVILGTGQYEYDRHAIVEYVNATRTFWAGVDPVINFLSVEELVGQYDVAALIERDSSDISSDEKLSSLVLELQSLPLGNPLPHDSAMTVVTMVGVSGLWEYAPLPPVSDSEGP